MGMQEKSAHKICVKIIRAENLYNTDYIGELDPYVELKLGGKQKKVTKNYTDAGIHPTFKDEDFELTYNYDPGKKQKKWEIGSKSATASNLQFKVKDADFLKSDFIGKAVICLRGLGPDGYEGPLQLYRSNNEGLGGVLYVRITHDLPVLPLFPFVLIPIYVHHNTAAGIYTGSEDKGNGTSFNTYEIRLSFIRETFGDTWNANYDQKHAATFANDATGIAKRAARVAEHDVLYREGLRPNALRCIGTPRTEFHWVGSFEDMGQVFGFGVSGNRRNVYTYSLIDSGLYCSETGCAISKDGLSKHLVHSRAAYKVRMAGTFRFCFDDATSTPVLVIDNDSGTYRPRAADFPLLEMLFERNFPGITILCLDSQQEQPEETKSLVGPCEVECEEGTERVYAGKWIWNYKRILI